MRNERSRKIIVAVAPVGREIAPPSVNPLTPQDVAREDFAWRLAHDGMADFTLLATANGLGAIVVRVGFEDSVYYAPTEAAETNALLVEKLVTLIRQMGCKVASCEMAGEMLLIQQ